MMRLLFYLTIIFCFIGITCPAQGDTDKSFIWVFLNSNPGKEELPDEEVQSLQKRHIENIGKLAAEGKLLVAGPFEGGGGMFIMNTDNMEEARNWILTDPAIRANRFHVEMFHWTPRIGSACLVDESAAMSERYFVRYVPHITKFNVQKAPELFLEHDRYLKKALDPETVLTEGIFGNNDGGIIIFKNEPDREMILSDPTVTEGIFLPEFKKIWVANGSFCEEVK